MPISFAAAFFGGLISLLSPCSALVIPTFAAAAAKRPASLIKTTAVFSGGLLLSLLPLALAASAIGQLMFLYRRPLTLAIGSILLVVGMLTIFGQHLPFPQLDQWLTPKKKVGQLTAIFLLGTIGGLGSSACVGPILGAILTLAIASHSSWSAVALLLTYAVGMIIPLVILSLALDSASIKKFNQLKSRTLSIKGIHIPLMNLLSGLLILLIAYIFLRHQGNLAQFFIFKNSRSFNFFFELQNKLYSL